MTVNCTIHKAFMLISDDFIQMRKEKLLSLSRWDDIISTLKYELRKASENILIGCLGTRKSPVVTRGHLVPNDNIR